MSKKQYEYLLFSVAVALAVFRFSYLGLEYIPYLDDYVQYSYYPNLQNNWQRVYTGGAGVLFTRPLAGIFDLFIWSKFWNNLGIAVGIISILHAISAVLFYKAFNLSGMELSPLFLIIYILCPLNIEATYWLSASSRIVVSMFFISLAAYFGAKRKLTFFFVFDFLSMWFYEQTAVLSFAVSVCICITNNKKQWIILPTILVALLMVFYLKFGFLGDNADRLSMATFSGLWQNASTILKSCLEISTNVLKKLLTRGFVRGFNQIAINFSVLWLGCLVVLAVMFFMLSQRLEKNKKSNISVWGIVFLVLPIIPFFALGETSLNLRNIAPCILGIAMVSDRLITRIFRHYACAFSIVLIIAFCLISVSEVVDYNYTAQQDLRLAAKFAESIGENTEFVRIDISTPKYYPQNAPYGDHIMSMTGSDWGMTGIVRALSGNEKVVIIKNSF